MSSRRHNYTYNPDEEQSLQGIPLPVKIRCGRCSKNINPASFSNNQLNNARRQVRDVGRITKAINCRKCTGDRIVELECTMCNKTKGIEEFAKSQRQNADKAKCFKCMEEQVSEEPIDEHRYEPGGNPFNTPDHSGGNYPKYFSATSSTADSSSTYGGNSWGSLSGGHEDEQQNISGQLHKMSVSGSVSETVSESEANVKIRDGDTGSKHETKSWHTGTLIESSACSSNKNSNAPTASMTGSSRSFASSAAERSAASGIGSNGWVKKSSIPLGSTSGPMRPTGDDECERESVVDAWGSDDDGGEEEEEDDDDSDDETII